MQDIVFYAAANETLGIIRDYTNERNAPAPVLTLGVSVCLRMRLFSSAEGAAPYSITALNGISDWQWNMDSDFDRGTACKLVADADSISVHTVTDTINGETIDFTEFVIPISNMNTEELMAWIGNEKMKSGLTGELVGYDSIGNASFVLQIEDFSVRNRVAGLGDPTVLDQETVTRTQAEYMIQTAVSTLVTTKQDKLTSANAGPGISITSSGIISAADVPQSAISGLSASLAAKQDTITAGYRMELVNGSTVDQSRYFAIEPALTASANQTTTVVLGAGKAYEIHAVANNAKVLLNRESPVGGSRTFGLDGHAKFFVANTGCVQTGENVVLANALEPDAVNNCTVRFHDGMAIISVEDHIAGYIVVSATGTTSGTLPYGISSAAQEYIAFDATTNGTAIDISGSTANGEKHVVGNGYADTILTGAVNCGTSKFTVANLALQNVAVNGGRLTLGDAYIPSGSTVAVSGGRLAVEKVTGAGSESVIDLGGTTVSIFEGQSTFASGVTFAGGNLYGSGGISTPAKYTLSACAITSNTATYGGGISLGRNASANCLSCTLTGNSATSAGGAIYVYYLGLANLSSCMVTGNSAVYGGGVYAIDGGTVDVKDSIISGNSGVVESAADCYIRRGATMNINGGCKIGTTYVLSAGGISLTGSNATGLISGEAAPVTLTSGATLDLTGNTNATPITPGGEITFASGGATVIVNGGTEATSSSYMMDNVTLPAGAKLTNTAVVNLGGASISLDSNRTAAVSGCIITGSTSGGAFTAASNTVLRLDDCVVQNNTGATAADAAIQITRGTLYMSGCTVSANTNGTSATGAVNVAQSTGLAYLSNCVLSGNTPLDLTVTVGAHTHLTGGNTVDETTLRYDGHLEIEGSNSIGSVSGSGTVTISGGATIDLTGNTNAKPIAPNGGITLYGGPVNSETKIIGSAGSATQTRIFEDATISGTSISKIGAIYGATITNVQTPDYIFTYTTDGGVTSNTATVEDMAPTDVPGTYGASAGVLSVTKNNS